MKKNLLFLLLFPSILCAQGYNADKTALTNFLVRMYKNAPYDVKVVNDYDNNYLISAVILDPAKYNGNESTMLRIASVKAMSQASRYFNGSEISADLIVSTAEHADGTVDTEMLEQIKEKSIGYVKQLEHMTNFDKGDNQQVFIYFKKFE